MFNPFDGATFLTGTVIMSVLGIISGSSPVLATIAGATVTGIFVLIAKALELAWKSRADKRVDELTKRAERAESDNIRLLEHIQAR
jgi:hypothetical protein